MPQESGESTLDHMFCGRRLNTILTNDNEKIIAVRPFHPLML